MHLPLCECNKHLERSKGKPHATPLLFWTYSLANGSVNEISKFGTSALKLNKEKPSFLFAAKRGRKNITLGIVHMNQQEL